MERPNTLAVNGYIMDVIAKGYSCLSIMRWHNMRVYVLQVKLRASWVHSLKEKRMVIKSLIAKLQNKFNISVAEISDQDIHQSIVIGIAGICHTAAQADSHIEEVIRFIEENTDAEVIDIREEINYTGG